MIKDRDALQKLSAAIDKVGQDMRPRRRNFNQFEAVPPGDECPAPNSKTPAAYVVTFADAAGIQGERHFTYREDAAWFFNVCMMARECASCVLFEPRGGQHIFQRLRATAPLQANLERA